MGKGTPISLKGKEVNMQGVLNVDNLTLEVEEFTSVVTLKSILEKAELDGKFVKIKIVETTDTPINEDELV